MKLDHSNRFSANFHYFWLSLRYDERVCLLPIGDSPSISFPNPLYLLVLWATGMVYLTVLDIPCLWLTKWYFTCPKPFWPFKFKIYFLGRQTWNSLSNVMTEVRPLGRTICIARNSGKDLFDCQFSQGVFFSAHRRISAAFPWILTPLKSVQIWGESRTICREVCLL